MATAGRILIMPKGTWNAETTYENLDLVAHNGRAWIAKKVSVGIEPSEENVEYWHDFLGMDVFTEVNPPTAEQVGALPLTGGTLSGNVGIGSGYGLFSGTQYGVTVRSNEEPNETNNSRGIIIATVRKEANSARALMFSDTVNGSSNWYQIFGEHNKPSGEYIGNGSATERQINIGALGGMSPLLLIHCGHHGTHVLVSRAGAIGWNSTNMYAFPDGTLRFVNGVLIMNGTDKAFNENGLSYYWREL